MRTLTFVPKVQGTHRIPLGFIMRTPPYGSGQMEAGVGIEPAYTELQSAA
jgi:hypothetical protein